MTPKIHRLEPSRRGLADRINRKRVTQRDISNQLPSFIRDKLVAASLAPRAFRAMEISKVTAHARAVYPQYFRQEESEE